MMHFWGEESFDWKGLDQAGHLIEKHLLRWKVPVRDVKEKFGELRVYCSFGWERGWLFMHLFYPTYSYYQFPRWVRTIDFWIPCHWLNFMLVPLQQRAYRIAYSKAIKSYPHLRAEIIDAADWPELLEGL